MGRTSNYKGKSVGSYEAALGASIVPDSDGHWIYHGRLPLDLVRAEVAVTFDPDLDPGVYLWAACGKAGCVRPPHMEGG
jgi:hypothetical protein